MGSERNGRAGTADSSGTPGGRLHRVRGYAPTQTEHDGLAVLRQSGDRAEDLADAITVFATDAARTIRTANRVCSSVHVFIETSRFRKNPHYAPSQLEALSPPTHNTRHIVWAAIKCLKEIYREGLAYKRAGVMLLDLVDARQAQASLFDRPDPKDGQLIEAMDPIERRMGPGAIRFGHSVSAARWRIPVATLYDLLGRYSCRENLSIESWHRWHRRTQRPKAKERRLSWGCALTSHLSRNASDLRSTV